MLRLINVLLTRRQVRSPPERPLRPKSRFGDRDGVHETLPASDRLRRIGGTFVDALRCPGIAVPTKSAGFRLFMTTGLMTGRRVSCGPGGCNGPSPVSHAAASARPNTSRRG